MARREGQEARTGDCNVGSGGGKGPGDVDSQPSCSSCDDHELVGEIDAEGHRQDVWLLYNNAVKEGRRYVPRK